MYTIISCMLLGLFASNTAYSQEYNCTSNDVRIVRAYLTTTVGGEISCVGDDPVAATLHLVVSTKTPRKGVFISADLYINNVKHSTIANCFDNNDVPLTGANNDLSYNVNIPCPIGKTIELRNVFTAWGTGNEQFCPSSTPATPSKCRFKEGEVIVVELLGSGFTFVQGACTGNDRSVEFIGNASGGTAPYTYEWFVDYGTANEVKFSTTANTQSTTDIVTKSFESGKDYSITLKVTDNVGAVKLTTHTVPVISCCMLEVTCPTSTGLGSFTCSNLNTLPATTGTLANLTSWYNIQVGTNPCGTVKWSASDDATPNTCSTSDQTITRTVIVWDDLNGDNIYNVGDEESQSCVFTYTVVADKTGPELKGTLPGSTGNDACMSGAPSAPSVSAIEVLYEDNCGTVTATLTASGFTQASTNCSWTKTYTYSVKDACQNETIAVVTYSGGDETAPTGTEPADISDIEGCKPTQQIAAAAFNATHAIGGYSDNCGGDVTAELTDTDVEGENCAWTITYTFSIKDACGNALAGQTYTRSGGDNTAPTGNGPQNITGEQGCMPSENGAAAGFDATHAATGYSDACGGAVTAILTGTSVSGDNCNWTITYTYNVEDPCGNSLTGQTYTRSGGDKTGPTFDLSAAGTLGWNPTPAQIEAAFCTVTNLQNNCGGTPTAAAGYPKYSTTSPVVNGCQRSWTRLYKFKDACNNLSVEKSCTVTWYVTPSNNCWSVDMLNAVPSGTGNSLQTTYTFRICSKGCGAALSYVAFVTGNTKITMINPLNGATYYSSPYTYKVVSPVSNKQNGVKFEIINGEGIKRAGDCNTITFTVKGQLPSNFTVEFKAGSQSIVPIVVAPNCLIQQSQTLRTSSSTMKAVTSGSVQEQQVTLPTEYSVTTYPNPYTDNVKFVVTSPVSGQGSLEVYNMIGQKIQTVYQGRFAVGTQNYNLTVPSAQRTNLIYVLRIGDKQITGKLMYVGGGGGIVH